jgi:hypothetical protein
MKYVLDPVLPLWGVAIVDPQRLKPQFQQSRYRSAEALRHPKSTFNQNQLSPTINFHPQSTFTQNQLSTKINLIQNATSPRINFTENRLH